MMSLSNKKSWWVIDQFIWHFMSLLEKQFIKYLTSYYYSLFFSKGEYIDTVDMFHIKDNMATCTLFYGSEGNFDIHDKTHQVSVIFIFKRSCVMN